MRRAHLALAAFTPGLFGNQLGHVRTHQRNLLDILGQTTFLPDRSLALRTAVQIDPDLFIDVLGLGSVESGVACFAPGPRWVSAALGLRTAKRRGLAVSLLWQLLQLFILFFDSSLGLFQLPFELHILQGQMHDLLHSPLTSRPPLFKLWKILGYFHG